MFRRLLRAVVLACSAAATAMAHGFISAPVARNVNSGTYCDQCLSGGGVQAVYADGRKFPNGKHGVCGDPLTGDLAGYHEGGGKFEKTVGIRITHYHAGDVIRVRGTLTANHLGYFQFQLCVLPPSSMGGPGERAVLNEACFARYPALRLEQNGRWGDRYYVKSGLTGFDISVKLPDLECPRCVFRWWYVTGNSCTPPGTPPEWAQKDLSICGAQWAPPPEEFWNCADVALLKKGAALPAVTSKKLKGELGTATGSNSSAAAPAPGASGAAAAAADASGAAADTSGAAADASGGGGGHALTFQNVAIAVVAGTGLAIPVVMLSPAVGVGAGILAFAVVLLVMYIMRQNEKFAPAGSCGHRRLDDSAHGT